MVATRVRLTPSDERALSRAVSELARILIRDLGWGWTIVIVATGMLGAAIGSWVPDWWDTARAWWRDGR